MVASDAYLKKNIKSASYIKRGRNALGWRIRERLMEAAFKIGVHYMLTN